MFSKYLLNILLLDWKINFWGSVFTLAASFMLHLLLFFIPTTFLLCVMSLFHHNIHLGQWQIYYALASKMRTVFSQYHVASRVMSSAVHFASRFAFAFTSSIPSFSAVSMFSSIVAAESHPTTLWFFSSSCQAAFTRHSITSWSDSVV